MKSRIDSVKIHLNEISNVISKPWFGVFSFTLLIAIAAQVTIPVKPVPITLQTMVVGLAGAILGARKGAYSMGLYLALGATGLPLFAAVPDAPLGIARFFSTTGGYLLAFPLGALAAGLIAERYSNYAGIVAAMFAANFVVILSGALFLDAFFINNLSETLKIHAALFSLPTVIKVIAGTALYFGLKSVKK
ncbi:MAG: biotin transporter BioY [Ignavibacteriaceae bacterium]|nr:biotin transporter BioY [Ignavibacteriaceae bacterium]NUM70573.1 biotin transporter BioY [Ignavibacteriaceae bacterium]